MQDLEIVEVVKAVWTAAFINDLPDKAFAVVLPGGKKDDQGKTVPRSLRMLPHHGPSVKTPVENTSVDLPHLRNGLARVSQANMPEDAKRRALAHLEAHAKELLTTKKPAKKDVQKVRIQVEKTALPLGPNQALRDFAAELREAVEAHLESAIKIKFGSTDTKSASFYPHDIFGDHMIAEVNQWQKGKGSTETYWLVPYARGVGGFVFGPPVEVEKQIQWVPKMPIEKRAGGLWSNVL